MNDDEFNKNCAEALGCLVDDDLDMITFLPSAQPCLEIFCSIEDRGNIFVRDMRFHDSYDWAMLLVKHIVKSKALEFRMDALDDIEHELLCLFGNSHSLWSSPQQISQACLEVLNG